MRVMGIDLAWAGADVVNETGVVAAGLTGHSSPRVDQGRRCNRRVGEATRNRPTVMFVDAPLLVLNAQKQRLCENKSDSAMAA